MKLPKVSASYPLFNPTAYHDACGTGFIAETSGQPSHRVVPLALDIIDYEEIYTQQMAIRVGVLLNE